MSLGKAFLGADKFLRATDHPVYKWYLKLFRDKEYRERRFAVLYYKATKRGRREMMKFCDDDKRAYYDDPQQWNSLVERVEI